MNIFKTFETYLKEPLSILRDNIIQIVSLQTGNIFERKSSINISMVNNKTQLTVVNNDKLYNLLSLVNLRVKNKQKAEENKNKEDSNESA